MTRRQKELLDFLTNYIREYGYAPTLEEIGENFGLTSLATVHKHLSNLESKGLIRRRPGQSRAVEIVPQIPCVCAATKALQAGGAPDVRRSRVAGALAEVGQPAWLRLRVGFLNRFLSTLPEKHETGEPKKLGPTTRRAWPLWPVDASRN